MHGPELLTLEQEARAALEKIVRDLRKVEREYGKMAKTMEDFRIFFDNIMDRYKRHPVEDLPRVEPYIVEMLDRMVEARGVVDEVLKDFGEKARILRSKIPKPTTPPWPH